ncbi:MAG TPA: cupin domain-containing protein [Rhodopila sp.]|nr:cupin domain-containing protein [Rhodopila sp.]
MPFKCTIPAQPTVQRDDADIRITRWDFPPGAVTGQHTHAHPYIVVMLTDALMRVDDGTAITETRMSAGQAYHRPAGVEHDVMNGADKPMAFVEIEIKRPQALAFA